MISVRRFRLASLYLVLFIVPLDSVVADDAEELKALRRVATNVQFHKDGAVRLVRLSKPIVADDSLALLKPFDRIEYLAVVAPTVTDVGITHLADLSALNTLLLSGTSITDEGLRSLREMTNLERLYLDDTAITDAGLPHLANLPRLRVVSLRRTHVSDMGLASLQPLTELEALFLDGNSITDAGLADLASFGKLQTLHLNSTQVTGVGMRYLAGLRNLANLNLTRTPLVRESIALLAEMPQLKILTLYETPLDADSLTTLRERLPQTGVFSFSPTDNSPEDLASEVNNGKLPHSARASDSAILRSASERFASADGSEVPDFQRHVLPLIGRLGCNGRACHGSFQGQGGFRLSMFGYDFDADHASLTAGESPRVDVTAPSESLILNKPTSDNEHGGGKRFESGSWQQALLHRWIASGAPPRPAEAADFVRLDVSPSEIVFDTSEQAVPLSAVAVWSDGTREDVTCLCRFETNDQGVAEVSADGIVISSGAGDTHVIIFYDNGITAVPVLRPVTDLVKERYPRVPTPTRIDELVVEKLSKLGITPSELASDEEFLRRVSLDMTGTLPTPQEIAEFLADDSRDKRSRKIDELLERPAYVAWWTMRLCDLTGSNAGYLGGTEMASRVAEQWMEWIRRRVAENTPYDQIVAGIVLATSRRPGQTYEDYIAEQSTYTRLQSPADYAAEGMPMPHYWYRDNISAPKDKALSFGYVFLGVRLQCAECHKHPYDQWSQHDFEEFTKFFTRVKAGIAPDATETHARMREMLAVPDILNTAALRRQSYLRIAAEGRPIPWNEIYIAPPSSSNQPAKLLGGRELNLADYTDPRQPLMQWLRDKSNPYFARAFVNRIWASYFNVGIIDPPDDLNLANPPSNHALLDYLTEQFIANDYDMKWLHREITNSRTYQLSWQPNDSNRRDTRNFSHAILRRLPAEVVVDAITQSTANDAFMKGVAANVAGRKIGDHPRSYQARVVDYSLLVFGKPLRTTNCDCERQNEPTLLQALYVRNDQQLLDLLDRRDGWLAQVERELAGNTDPKESPDEPTDQFITAAYLRTLSRQPSADELAACREHVNRAESALDGLRDLLWALVNSDEFITNH